MCSKFYISSAYTIYSWMIGENFKHLCEQFVQKKEELHKENDPEVLKEAGWSYDVRHWNLSSEVNPQKLRTTLQKKIKDHFEKVIFFLKDEIIHKFLEEFGILTQNCPLQVKSLNFQYHERVMGSKITNSFARQE